MALKIKILYVYVLAHARMAFAPARRLGVTLGRHLTPQRLALASGASLLLLVSAYLISFYWPRSVMFSYARANCFANPVLLPGLVSSKPSSSFKVTRSSNLSIGNHPLYSQTTCITPTAPPTEKRTETITLEALGFLKKTVKVAPETRPVLKLEGQFEKPVGTKQQLNLMLDRADRTFTYRLVVQDQKLACPVRDRTLTCDLAQLQLAQSTAYPFILQRLFNGKLVDTLLDRPVATVEAIRVTGASIAAGQMIYDTPSQMTLTLSKTAKSTKEAHLYALAGDTRQELPTTITITDKTITVQFKQPLPRSASLVLDIQDIYAPDGGYLMQPFSLPFNTSGGPKVLGINIGSTRVQPTTAIVLTFDSAVSATQAVGEFVRLEAGGGAVAAAVSVQGRTVTLRPQSALPRCTGLTVKVLDGLQNNFGIAGGSAWQFRSRTLCQTVFSIGTSVQGRGITAHRFGSGPSKIIFVGGTHGDEKSSTYLLTRWIDYLESNADRIPAHRSIIVIPNLNPDGYAANRRTNANNVDLNRNFPSNNWKSGVTMPDKSFLPQGGGIAPLSEPESSALTSYVVGQNPRLVLTYHATGSVVVPNDSGDSYGLAVNYGKQSSVSFMPNGQTATFFEYDTTGAFEDWLHDKHNIPTLLVELATKTGNEFSGHQNALWALAQLP